MPDEKPPLSPKQKQVIEALSKEFDKISVATNRITETHQKKQTGIPDEGTDAPDLETSQGNLSYSGSRS